MQGLFLIEVFPALALAALEQAFCRRLGAPKYNPANRKRFKQEDWQAVSATIRGFGALRALEQLEQWSAAIAAMASPRTADQDMVDAVICGLIGLHWLAAPREHSVVIGNMDSGYMVAPAINGVHERLIAAATRREIPII